MNPSVDGISHGRLLNPTNPSIRATAAIRDHPSRARATIRQSVGVSTMFFRRPERIDNDKAALERSEAARQEMDYLPGATACFGHFVEVSKQNAGSTDTLRVKPSQRTRFASRSAIDRAQRTADAALDHPAWL